MSSATSSAAARLAGGSRASGATLVGSTGGHVAAVNLARQPTRRVLQLEADSYDASAWDYSQDEWTQRTHGDLLGDLRQIWREEFDPGPFLG